jgi:hypothetical protein
VFPLYGTNAVIGLVGTTVSPATLPLLLALGLLLDLTATAGLLLDNGLWYWRWRESTAFPLE